MPQEKQVNVTMRVRIADAELEVTGPQQFVDEKIAAFLKEQRDSRPPHQTATPPASVGVSPSPVIQGKGLSAAQFFKKVRSKSDVERVLVAGYFLEKHNGADSFTTAEISEAIRQAKINPPSNTADAVSKNIKKGLMMSAGDKEGRKAYVLTSDGEEAVATVLNSTQ